MTLEELAERIGRTSRYILAIKNEERGVSLDTLIKLIRPLNISADTIAYLERNITDSEDEQLIRLIQRLNSRNKDIIRAAAQKLLDSE